MASPPPMLPQPTSTPAEIVNKAKVFTKFEVIIISK
jgi:hypothetical protein